MKTILAIDQGTTASKAALFSLSGRLLGLGRVPLKTLFGPGGRADQDPDEILSSQRRAIREALSGAQRHEIVAAGIASQRSTFVLWDRATGRPVGAAPTWQSTIAAGRCLRLQEHGARVRRLTGLPLSPHYSASKIGRLLAASSHVRRRARRGDLMFGNVATFLIWHFTGGKVHAVDPTQAARTLLLNHAALDWDPWLLEAFDVPRAILPQVRPSLGDFGTLRIGRREIPIRACLGDQQAALLGSLAGAEAIAARREVLVNYGTGAFVLVPTGEKPVRRPGLLTSLAFTSASRRVYLLEGTINAAGAALDWLRRDLGAPADLAKLDALCRAAPGGAMMLPAWGGLGSAFFDPADARLPSVILGAGPDGTLADLTRAAVESIAHMVAVILERVTDLPGGAPRRVVATGPLSRLRYLMEFQAALAHGVPLVVSGRREATLAGIARAACLASGAEASRAAASWRSGETAVRVPVAMARAASKSHEQWLRMVQWARRWR